MILFFFSSRRRHTRLVSDWSSDVCSSDLPEAPLAAADARQRQWGRFMRPIESVPESWLPLPQAWTANRSRGAHFFVGGFPCRHNESVARKLVRNQKAARDEYQRRRALESTTGTEQEMLMGGLNNDSASRTLGSYDSLFACPSYSGVLTPFAAS